MGLLSELRRRNVIRVAIAYAVAAWILIEITATTFPILKLPDWSVTLVTVLVLIGFPLALIFAWAFELTPEGLKRERDVDRSESITHVTGRKLDYLIIVALVFALGYFAFDKFVLDPERDAELVQTTTESLTEQAAETADKSIAVLPFVNMSADPEQEYFSDGISEELLNVLAKIPDLFVVARSSSFQFKGENRDIIDIGQQLNVAYILEGSVRKADVQVRITAQLIDASSGFHLWSETYDRVLDDIFAVQDEISADIVMALKEHLGLQVEAAPRVIATANTEAHDAYLRGRHLVVQPTEARIEDSIRKFKQALVLDPDYALAHAEIASATLGLIRSQWGNLSVAEAVAGAAPHAERALALDPTLAQAQAANGDLMSVMGKYEEASNFFRQAIRDDPNYARAYNGLSLVYGDLGRYKESFAMTEAALRLDPLSMVNRANYFHTLIEMNRLADADRELEKYASYSPNAGTTLRGKRASLGGHWGNWALGYLDSLRQSPHRVRPRNQLAKGFAVIGLEKEALSVSEHSNPRVLRWLGQPEGAITIAEASLAENSDLVEPRAELALALAAAGDYVRAKPILDELWQQSSERVTRWGPFQFDSAAALIAIRRTADEGANVGELIAAMRDNVRRYREAGFTRINLYIFRTNADYEEGLAAFFAGEHERGLALIAKAAEDGVFISLREAYLQALYDHPGFAPIRASQEARQARERERILAIVCTDNPYEAVWQPAEGTCEQYAATGGN